MTFDRLYADFQVIETHAVIPAVARAVLDRFAEAADTVFVKSGRYGENEAMYWAMEREFFFALENPLTEVSDAHGLYAIFPRGCAWYLHYPSDTPIVYVGGGADLITALAQVLDDRLLPLTLTDKYYS